MSISAPIMSVILRAERAASAASTSHIFRPAHLPNRTTFCRQNARGDSGNAKRVLLEARRPLAGTCSKGQKRFFECLKTRFQCVKMPFLLRCDRFGEGSDLRIFKSKTAFLGLLSCFFCAILCFFVLFSCPFVPFRAFFWQFGGHAGKTQATSLARQRPRVRRICGIKSRLPDRNSYFSFPF